MTENKNQQQANSQDFEHITPVEFEPASGARRGGLNRHRWLTITAFSLLAILSSLALYLFTGHSVLISFDPPAEEVELSGALLNFKLGERWLLHPGDFDLSATLEGYHPFSAVITVTDTPQQEFLYSLRKLPGFLDINTVPEVVGEIRLDGATIGATPLAEKELEPGSYELEIQTTRFQPYSVTVEIEGGGKSQQLLAELVPAWSDVTLTSDPAGAVLWVEGEATGETPLTTEIMMGTRRIELRLPGHKTWAEDLRVPTNDPIVLEHVVLEKADNLVRLESRPSRASVTVDGDYRGETPLELEMKPGREYQFRFNKAGYKASRRTLFVEEGNEVSLRAELEPILGRVLVSGRPADAMLFVDGTARGSAKQTLLLTARPHTIEIRKTGYESFQGNVLPNPDLEQEISASLRSLEDIRLARTPPVLKTATGYEMRLVGANGTIRMGSARREQGRRNNEFEHQVSFSKAFYIGMREINNAEIGAFIQSHDSGVVDKNTLSLPQQPGVRVSWNDAARYCNWLSEQDGLPAAYVKQDDNMVPVSPMTTGYRLPTEAEWVLVARYQGNAGNRAALKYSWGSQLPPPLEAGNFAGQESARLVERAISNYRDQFPTTAPVGVFEPNSIGIYDLGGNVREWIHDYYAIASARSRDIPVDYLGPDNGIQHVIRGSGWRSGTISNLRLAWRAQGIQGGDDLGFRLARYAD